MIGKKINQLATELAPTTTDLTIIGDPVTGVSKKITLEQLGAIFGGAVSFYTTLGDFPATGVIDIIYCAKDTKKLYLWSGSAYVEVFPSQSLLDTYQLRSEKGVSNGYASLDVNGKVPIGQLPNSIMEYKGTWNAATNTPTLANGTGDTGDVYICNAAGTVNFGAGPITFAVGDYVVYSGTIWQRSSGAVGTVTSVGLSITGDSIGVTGSPITTSGTLALAFAGNSTQYINGAGNLVTFPGVINEAQNLITEVYNKTGATLTKGTVVYINGGQGNLPAVTKALATGDSTSAQTYGIVRNDITNNNNGYVVVAGRISDLDTQAYTEGTQLYLSPTTAGTFTSTKPYAPQHLVYVGIVVRAHPTQGVVEVKIQNGYELDELHNVAAQSPDNNDILQYKTATSLWTKVAGTTTNIAEGTNLYYTDARSRAALSFTAGSGAYNSTTGVITIPTNTNQLTNGAAFITLASLSAGAGISYNNTTGVIASTITQYTDALARAAISLTTTGTSGAATYNNTTGVLNIPQYQTALTNPVTGTGTTNYLPKFTGTSTIGNSLVFDNGTNVGIGTALPGYKLEVNGIIAGRATGNGGRLETIDTTTGANLTINPAFNSGEPAIQTQSNSPILFAPNNTIRMRLDTSGNLGLGVTPSAWSTSYRAFQFGATGVLWANATGTDWYLGNNEIYNSSNQLVFLANGRATEYYQFDGQHIWNTSTISGTAGNVITFNPAMRLGSNSGLSIGTTTAAAANGLLVAGAATFSSSVTASTFTSNVTSGIFLNNGSGGTNATQIRINNTGGDARMGIESSTGGTIQIGTSAYSAVFGNQANAPTEFTTNGTVRMTILGSGNVGIGTTSPADILDVTRSSASNSTGGITLTNTDNSGYGAALNWNLKLNSTAGVWGRVYVEAASSTATFMSFQTTVGSTLAERMRINSAGNVGIGTTSPASFLHIGTYASAGKYIDSSTLPNTPSNYLITLSPPSTTGYYGGGIGWSEGTNTAAGINAYDDGAGGALGLSFATGTNSGLTERMRITSGGAVEMTGTIKTASPSSGSAHAWKLGSYAAGGTGTATGVIYIEVNGQIYSIPALLGTP
jgi:hypothetical protein